MAEPLRLSASTCASRSSFSNQEDYSELVELFNEKEYEGKEPEDFVVMFMPGLKNFNEYITTNGCFYLKGRLSLLSACEAMVFLLKRNENG